MKKIALFLAIMISFGLGVFQVSAESPIACPMDVKLCPDGKTWVGREAPNCEFQKCPDTKICPVVSPPYCQGRGYEVVGEYEVNGCKLPKFECKLEAHCPAVVEPVCATTNVVCVKAPCPKLPAQEKTYSNSCEAKKAGATVIHKGECKTDPIVCTEEYAPVCGQPQMPKCPTGTVCPQVMPEHKTYGNKCELLREGAEFLYEGECKKICPEYDAPMCDYTITGYKEENGCKQPIFKCKNEGADVHLKSLSTNTDTTSLTKGSPIILESKMTVTGVKKGAFIPFKAQLRNSKGTLVNSCIGKSIRTTTDTLEGNTETIEHTCSINYFKWKQPDGGKYSVEAFADSYNYIKEVNENNNKKSIEFTVGASSSGGPTCPIYGQPMVAPGCKIISKKDKNGCYKPEVICEDDLSPKLKRMADDVLKKYKAKLKAIEITNEDKIKQIEELIVKLEKLGGPDKSKTVNALIKYLVKGLEAMKADFKEDDVESILELFQ